MNIQTHSPPSTRCPAVIVLPFLVNNSLPQVSLLRAPLGSATPDAAVILKKTGSGALGANLASTGFDDAAAAEFPAAAESAPFTGAFKPAQPLTAFAGKDASGKCGRQPG
jgi:hypothetical protein